MPFATPPNIATIMDVINNDRPMPISLDGRYEVGSGAGAYAITTADGTPLVLKWWPATDIERERFDSRSSRIPLLRHLGWPIPDLVESGDNDIFLYELWQKAPGKPCVQAPAPFGVVAASSELVARARGAALGNGSDWPAWLRNWIPGKLAGIPTSVHPRTREVISWCLEAAATASIPPGRDLIHGDFTPANLLVDRDRIMAVIDLDDCRDGDGTLDLIGIAWDLEGWNKALPAMIDAMWLDIMRSHEPGYLRVLLAYWISGTLAWAAGTEYEPAKIDLAIRAWERIS